VSRRTARSGDAACAGGVCGEWLGGRSYPTAGGRLCSVSGAHGRWCAAG
jgi:hypothetical protein